MRRIIVVLTLTLTTVIFASGQTPKPRGQATSPKGRVLVKKLPAGVEGVTIVKGKVKLKPGYKFVKQEDGSVTVERTSGGGGGLGAHGTWSCLCNLGGACQVILIGGISCASLPFTCSSGCTLLIVIAGVKTGIIMY